MPSTVPYSLVFVGIILTASLAVLGQDNDPCIIIVSCQDCVTTPTKPAPGNNGTCIYELTRTGSRCVKQQVPSEEVINAIYKPDGCAHLPTPAPAPGPNTTTTTAPTPTTNGTTPAPTTTTPSTNTTTTAPTTPPTTAPTNGTTVPTTTVPATNGTTTTTTIAPPTTNGTTVAPPPGPAPTPRKGGFAWGEFIGGIVFAIAVSSLAYLIWRFYKARLDRNYHTFANPTF